VAAQSFLSWNDVRDKYRLEEADYPRYNRLVATIPLQWIRWLIVDFDYT
jgi:hypothetical protein